MGNIKLLDCTLSDGGHLNDWMFGEKAIKEIVEMLEESKIDIIETGILKDTPHQKNISVYNNASQPVEWITEKKHEILYSVVVEAPEYVPLALERCTNAMVDNIKVIVSKELLDEGFKSCRSIIEQGYKLSVQPERADQYSYEEFEELIELFNQLDIMAFYVADDWGTQTTEQAIAYMRIADKCLKPSVSLGYHGRNNMMQAYGIAAQMILENFARDIIIDASVYGIGSGAGNLNMGIIAKHLNECCGKTYLIEPLLRIAEKHVIPICDHAGSWGYSYHHYLTAFHRCNPEYGRYFKKQGLGPEVQNNIYGIMNQKDKNFFDKKKADSYHKKYAKGKMNLAVIVATCDRDMSINSLLLNSAWQMKKYGIDLIIFDSSTDDKTEIRARNFQLDGCDNVIYKRYEGEFDGFSLDHKVIAAYQEYVDQYDYIWICRDGLIISIDECYEKLLEYTREGYDYIVVDAAFRNGNEERETVYDNCVDFFKDQAVRIVTLGTLILSSKMAKTLIQSYPISQENYSLWQMVVPFHYYARHDVKAVGYIGSVFYYNKIGTLNSFWNKAGKSLDQWAFRWYYVVDNLPPVYDVHKEEVLKINMSDFHPFWVSSLLRMRGNGGLNLKLINKYQEYFPHVCTTARWKFIVVALIPRWIARYIVNNPRKKLVRGLKTAYDLTFN